MRRWVKVSVAAAVILGVGGYVAQPYVKEWVLIRDACGGGLPRDAVEQLTPDGSVLDSEESTRTKELGSYTCEVTLAGGEADGERFVSVAAYTRRDDQDRVLTSVFTQNGFDQQAPLPEGMPGFVDQFGSIRLLVPCPDLPADDDGRKHKLLVSVHAGRDVLTGVPGAAHRMAVALTGAASDELGCGAEPLKAPERAAPLAVPPDDPKRVPVARAEGTACGWVTGAGLPADGRWQIAVGANDASPSGRCDVFSAEDGEDTEDPSRLALASWYGDWSNRLTALRDNGTPRSMTATAQCEGEAANYALVGSQDIPGVGVTVRQRMLKLFAEGEVRRRGCSGLRFHF
ncbi:hypothetical protein ACIRD8_16760 [Streptomyces sp. NPDC102451]|uniref:hypothetical protein n=1 Tax=Streptomyces sp. NPDC102451 TaxID=3366177 RepID=UPI0037FB99B5